ncbi:hypothetical protein E2493_05095 [Sphingomonas parva]|uniref:Uncharacterized protein n=1 Tax=Sphingomonas parva TaxID=2555898 RepID=A0A4Y8ZVR0_9SPHN|nr:hypothetical protein [Sphingomonas parva]TFI59225.1 hypothetical protein E2493_05095 [Sphingomonas parva]
MSDSDLDLEKLAELWNEPDASTAEDVDALARRARREARLMGWADTALAVIIVGSLVLGAMMKPSLPVAAGALLTIVMTLWLNWKRRNFRQINRTLAAATRTDFLESSIRLARTRLRRATFSLITFPPAILAALLYRVSTKGEIDHPVIAIVKWAASLRGMVALGLLVLLFLWMLRSRRRQRDELRRLEEIHRDYAEEAEREQRLEV